MLTKNVTSSTVTNTESSDSKENMKVKTINIGHAANYHIIPALQPHLAPVTSSSLSTSTLPPQNSNVSNLPSNNSSSIFVSTLTNSSTLSKQPTVNLFSSARQNRVLFDGFGLKGEDLKLENELGSGDYGKVWHAYYHGQEVAAKQLYTKQGLSAERKQEEFEHEAMRMASLNHPNIISFYGFCQKNNDYYMVIEYCPRGSLWQNLKADWMDWKRKWQIALDIIQGLRYLHSQGILHRDLKADNVLIGEDGHAYLSDFGLAIADTLLASKQPDSVIATNYIPFASPEQCRGDLSTTASDIYSFGVLLWQIVTAKVPYAACLSLNNAAQVIQEKIRGGEIEIIPEDCPIGIRNIIENCWQLDPQSRPSAANIVASLMNLASTHCPSPLEAFPYCPYPTELSIYQKMAELVHERSATINAYVPSFASKHDVTSSWDEFWSKYENPTAESTEQKSQSVSKVIKDNEKTESPENVAEPLKPLDSLLQIIEEFLESNERSLVILGDGGVGKTLTMHKIATDLLAQLHPMLTSQDELPWLPIFIRPAFNQWSLSALKDGIAAALQALYNLRNTNIEKLYKSKILFIIDGFDELTIDTSYCNLAAYMNFDQWPHAKLIFTSRRYIVNTEQEKFIFAVDGQYSKLYLLPFNMNQMLDYLTRQLGWDKTTTETCRTQIQRAHQLRELLRTPFVLNIFMRNFTRLLEQKHDIEKLTRYTLYSYAIDNWMKTQGHLLAEDTQNYLKGGAANLAASYDRFAARVAYYFFQEKVLKEGMKKLPSEFHDWIYLEKTVNEKARNMYHQKRLETEKDEQQQNIMLLHENDFAQLQLLKLRQFITFAPLQCRAGEYSFVHKSFYEYFALKHIVNVLMISEDLNQNIALLTQRSLQEEPKIFAFWSEFWQDAELSSKEKLKEKLFQVVYASRQHAENSQAAANAITLLNAARVSFSGLDLSNISIPGADLQYALLDHTNLSGTNLQNVHLEDAFLHETKLCGSNMEGMLLGAEGGYEIDRTNAGKVEESSDGKLLILGGKGAEAVIVLSLEKQKKLAEIPVGRNGEFQFSPQGDLLVLGGSNAKAAYIWSVKEQKQIAEIPKEYLDKFQFSPQGDHLLVFLSARWYDFKEEYKAYIWSVKEQKLIAEIPYISEFHFSPQGDLLVLGGKYTKAAYIWSVKEQKQLAEIPGGGLGEFQFSPQGDLLVFGGEYAEVAHIWSVKEQKQIAEIPCENLEKFQFSPQGDLLVLGGLKAKAAYIWSVKEQKLVAEILCEKDEFMGSYYRGLDKFQFSSQGDLLVLGGEHTKAAYIWSVKEQKQLAEIPGGGLGEFQFSPQGDLLVLGGEYAEVAHIWSVKEQKQIAVPVGRNGKFQFSPQGNLLVLGGLYAKAVYIWSVKEQKQIAEIPCEIQEEFQFSPQGDLLGLSGIYTEAVYIWSVKEQKQIAEIPVGKYGRFQFSPQGDLLVSGGGAVYIWSVKELKQLGKLEDVVGDGWLGNNIFVVHKHNNCYICDATNIGQDKMFLIKEMPSPIEKVDLLKASKLLISSEKNCYLCIDYILRMKNKRLIEPSGVNGSISEIKFFAQDFLLCVGRDASIFSIKEQKQIAKIPCENYHALDKFKFSPQGELLVLGGEHAKAAFWSVKEQKQIATIPDVESFQFSPQGNLLVLIDSSWFPRRSVAHIWSVKEQKQIATIPDIESFQFSPQGDLLVLGGFSAKAAYIWLVKEQKQLAEIPGGGLGEFQFSPQGDLLVLGGPHTEATYIWSVKEKKQLAEITAEGLDKFQFSPQGNLLVLIDDSSWFLRRVAHIWSVKEQKQIAEIPHISELQFSPQGVLLALGGRDAEATYIWSVKEQKQLAEITAKRLDKFRFSPQGDLLVLGGYYAEATYIWSVKEQKQIAEIPHISEFQFSPQGDLLVLGGYYAEATYIWSVKEQKQIAEIPHISEFQKPGHDDRYEKSDDFQFSPQGDILVFRRNKEITFLNHEKEVYIWSIKEQKLLTQISVGNDGEFKFSPQGDILVFRRNKEITLPIYSTFNHEKEVYIWSIKEQKLLTQISVGKDGEFKFSPNQKLIAIYGKSSCYLYDISQNKLYCVLQDQGVNTVAFSEDSHWLATGGEDRTLRLWDISDPSRPLLQYCSSGLTLYAKDVNIENVHGLSTANRALLKQRGAIDEATKIVGKTEEKNSTSLSTTSSMQITEVKEEKDNGQQLVQEPTSSISPISTTAQSLQQQSFFAQQSSSSIESSNSSESLGNSNQNRLC